jgi:hypothetical protein
MPMTDGFFEDDYFVQHQSYSYEDPEDMASFGALMDKFAGRMYDLEGWSIVAVNAHNEYVRVTSRIKKRILFPPTVDRRHSPCQTC